MKKKSNKSLFLIMILAVFIIIIGIYFGKYDNSVQNNLGNQDSEAVNNDTINFGNFKGNIVYLSKSTEGTDLFKVGNDKKPINFYTDRDDEIKIKSAASMTLKGKILAVMGSENQEFGGSLYLIDTTQIGNKEKLIDQFASTDVPIISPNGNKIAYTIFSNIESDYGFSLYSMNPDGSNKFKITGDDISIKILSWSSNGSNISYTKGDTSKASKIYVYDFTAGKEKELIEFKEKIYSLSWSSDGFIFSKGSSGDNDINKAEIFKMDENTKNIKKITSDDKHNNFGYYSPDMTLITYLSVVYEKNVDLTRSGEIVIANISGDFEKIADANTIIGWIGK